MEKTSVWAIKIRLFQGFTMFYGFMEHTWPLTCTSAESNLYQSSAAALHAPHLLQKCLLLVPPLYVSNTELILSLRSHWVTLSWCVQECGLAHALIFLIEFVRNMPASYSFLSINSFVYFVWISDIRNQPGGEKWHCIIWIKTWINNNFILQLRAG